MRKQAGLTRVDCVVVLACVVFVLANVPVIIAGGRGRAKIEVCLANLRALADAWQMHSNDNDGKIASGDVYYSWAFPASAGGPQPAWREWPHTWPHAMPPSAATNYSAAYPLSCTSCTQADWEHAIAEGKLWEYVRDYNLYRCPVGAKNQYVTYAMSHSMNTYPGTAGTDAPMLTNINQIIRPSDRFVFLDAGYAKRGAFFVSYSSTYQQPGKWYDLPPMQHNQGTTFVFADGHTEYRKWTDPHIFAVEDLPWGGGTVDYCDCDLRWMTKITWGNVPYVCTDPLKNCPD